MRFLQETKSDNPSRRIFLAIVLPIVAQAVVVIPLGAPALQGWHHLTGVAEVVMLIATTVGFLWLARPLKKIHAAVLAVVYYPLILALSAFVDLAVGITIFGGDL